jgi:hypothetical protein
MYIHIHTHTRTYIPAEVQIKMEEGSKEAQNNINSIISMPFAATTHATTPIVADKDAALKAQTIKSEQDIDKDSQKRSNVKRMQDEAMWCNSDDEEFGDDDMRIGTPPLEDGLPFKKLKTMEDAEAADMLSKFDKRNIMPLNANPPPAANAEAAKQAPAATPEPSAAVAAAAGGAGAQNAVAPPPSGNNVVVAGVAANNQVDGSSSSSTNSKAPNAGTLDAAKSQAKQGAAKTPATAAVQASSPMKIDSDSAQKPTVGQIMAHGGMSSNAMAVDRLKVRLVHMCIHTSVFTFFVNLLGFSHIQHAHTQIYTCTYTYAD